MRSFAKYLAAILCLLLVTAMAGCGPDAPGTTATTVPATTLQPQSAREKYALASAEVAEAKHLLLSYARTELRLVGQDTYTRSVTGTASYSNIDGRDLEAVVEEQLTYGSYKSGYKEVYCDGAAFAEVNGSAFTAELTPREFLDRQLPAVLLQQELYSTVTAAAGAEESIVLTFSGASAAESWTSLPAKAKFISGSGTASLNSQGSLTQSSYKLEYQLGTVRYTLEVSVRVTMPKSLDLGAIHTEHFRNCPKLEVLDAPKMLLQVVGDVYTTQAFRGKAMESVFSEAIPMSYSQKSTFALRGSGENMTANANYVVTLSDYRGQQETDTRQDAFSNGIYTSVKDGTSQQTAITAQAMRQHYEDAILSALLAPTFLENATAWTGASQYHLELTGNDAFARALIEEMGTLLQVELSADAVSVNPEGCGGYIAIDRNTGLPVEMGLFLDCTHTVGGIEYAFTYRLEQELTLSDFA